MNLRLKKEIPVSKSIIVSLLLCSFAWVSCTTELSPPNSSDKILLMKYGRKGKYVRKGNTIKYWLKNEQSPRKGTINSVTDSSLWIDDRQFMINDIHFLRQGMKLDLLLEWKPEVVEYGEMVEWIENYE